MQARTSSKVRNPFSFEKAAERKSVWASCGLSRGYLDLEESSPSDFSGIIMLWQVWSCLWVHHNECGKAHGQWTAAEPMGRGAPGATADHLLQSLCILLCTVQGGNPKTHVIYYPALEEGCQLFSVSYLVCDTPLDSPDFSVACQCLRSFKWSWLKTSCLVFWICHPKTEDTSCSSSHRRRNCLKQALSAVCSSEDEHQFVLPEGSSPTNIHTGSTHHSKMHSAQLGSQYTCPHVLIPWDCLHLSLRADLPSCRRCTINSWFLLKQASFIVKQGKDLSCKT